MSSSQDVRFSEERVKQGADLANKLWNASRLILLRVDDVDRRRPRPETVEDRWIVSRLERADRARRPSCSSFRFSRAALELYDVFWSEVCDWYLELVEAAALRRGRRPAASRPRCCTCSSGVLALLHPVMPFVTEEIWSLLPGERGLLAVRRLAASATRRCVDDEAEAVVGRLIEAVTRAAPLPRRASAPSRRRAMPGAARRPTGYDEHRATTSRASRRFELVDGDGDEPVATRRRPGRRRAGAAARTTSTPTRPAGASARGERSSRRRSSAPRASSPTSASSSKAPAAGGRGRARQARRATARSCERLEDDDLPRRPRSTCSASSCSACASGSTACTS